MRGSKNKPAVTKINQEGVHETSNESLRLTVAATLALLLAVCGVGNDRVPFVIPTVGTFALVPGQGSR